MQLSERIKNCRIKKKLTQADVARRIPISQSSYSKFEQGTLDPDLKTLKRLCEIFQVSADYLLEVELRKDIVADDFDAVYKAYRLLQKILEG